MCIRDRINCITYKTKETMNIKPLADRVLILPAPAEEKTIGGIIIPDTAKAVSYTHLDVYKRQQKQHIIHLFIITRRKLWEQA